MQSTLKVSSKEALPNWQALIHQWKSSGKSALAWCREHNVPYHHFLRQRRQLSIKSLPDFIELPPESSDKSGLNFTVGGIQLTLERNFDEETLLKCLRVMRRV